MSSAKMSQDAKKEEFKKYLEKAGVLKLLTKSLVSLYEEPEKPNDAVNYLKKSVGGTDNDKVEIDKLQAENTDLKSKVSFHILLSYLFINILFYRLLPWRRARLSCKPSWQNWRRRRPAVVGLRKTNLLPWRRLKILLPSQLLLLHRKLLQNQNQPKRLRHQLWSLQLRKLKVKKELKLQQVGA